MASLILPAAGFSTRYPNVRPKWMLTHPFGSLMLLESISGLEMKNVGSIYVTILQHHVDKYDCIRGIQKGFRQAGLIDKLELLVLPEPTRHQPQTVAETIERKKITGPIFIKDTDNYFVSPINGGNFVSVFSLESMELVNAANKSYAQTNEGFITNIIEKRVISPLFCCGGYGFADAAEFMKHYEVLKDKDTYISHIIYKMMLDEDIPFRAVQATEYEDWGTLDDWLRYQQQFGAVFVDIDGVLVENSGEYFPPIWGTTDAIQENVDKINELYDGGKVRVILTTSRRSVYRWETEEQLRRCNIRYHHLIMDIPHGKRYLLNDYAPSNPFPACIAINTPRNTSIADKLSIPVKVRKFAKPKQKDKSRVAICISGLPRTYEKTIDNFRSMVMSNECDVFISTWDQNDSKVSTEAAIRNEEYNKSRAEIDRLAEAYQPKLIEFEPEFKWDERLIKKFSQRKRKDTFVPASLYMFYKVWAADQMRQRYARSHGIEYDVVIRTRFDVIFDSPLGYDLSYFTPTMILPEMWTERCDQFHLPWYNDTFAIGKPEEMAVYANIFHHIEEMFDDGIPFQPEIMLCEWLKRNGISVTNECPYPRLVRVSGKITQVKAGRPV